MLWLALFQYPMIVVVQEMCARIGLVTGSGLAAVIKKKYSRKVVLTIASLIVIANTINICADIGVFYLRLSSIKALTNDTSYCKQKICLKRNFENQSHRTYAV
jgi:Mn2+/Fe2+ NRAMP family transporter